EMAQAVGGAFARATGVVRRAAGAAYRPRQPHSRKLKKTASAIDLALERNPDILAGLGSRKAGRLLVGFAAETHDVAAEARRKLAAKHLDLIVANDVTAPRPRLRADTHTGPLLDPAGRDEGLAPPAKGEGAERRV